MEHLNKKDRTFLPCPFKMPECGLFFIVVQLSRMRGVMRVSAFGAPRLLAVVQAVKSAQLIPEKWPRSRCTQYARRSPSMRLHSTVHDLSHVVQPPRWHRRPCNVSRRPRAYMYCYVSFTQHRAHISLSAVLRVSGKCVPFLCSYFAQCVTCLG